MRARSIRFVPRPVLLLLIGGLAAQISWHGIRPNQVAHADALPPPPTINSLRVSSAGDPLVASKLLVLWLQAFDNQSGISVPFSQLDYGRVAEWLGRILQLDPRAQYPLLAASRVYGNIRDSAKKRQMFEFVYERFLERPNLRWPWLAHAVIEAKHHLEDLPLALKYARALTEHATSAEVPAWARDMSVSVLEDMGEPEAARILVGGLIESGRVTDPHELKFLLEKLDRLEARPRQQ